MTLPTDDAVWDALRTVNDPEVGMNVVDLGLVYRVEVDGADVRVELTMTSPACPPATIVERGRRDPRRRARRGEDRCRAQLGSADADRCRSGAAKFGEKNLSHRGHREERS
jgi:metal-sulfur cluster biosynthetic enzyme